MVLAALDSVLGKSEGGGQGIVGCIDTGFEQEDIEGGIGLVETRGQCTSSEAATNNYIVSVRASHFTCEWLAWLCALSPVKLMKTVVIRCLRCSLCLY